MNWSNQEITSLEACCPVLTQSDTRNEGIFELRAARYRGAQARSNPWQFVLVLVLSVSGTRTRTRTRTRRNRPEYEYHFIEYKYEGGGVIKIDDQQSRGCRGPCRNVGGLVSR